MYKLLGKKKKKALIHPSTRAVQIITHLISSSEIIFYFPFSSKWRHSFQTVLIIDSSLHVYRT